VGFDKVFQFRKRLETPWYLYSWDGNSYDANGEPVLVKSKKGYTAPNLTQGMSDNLNLVLNTLVNYDRTFGVHGLKIMAGAERRHERGDNFSAFRRNLMSQSIDQLFTGAVDDFQQIDGRAFQRARLNYFGRVNYTFSEKYLAEFVWRYDGTYQFRGNQYGFFPGLSLGWRISEEDFWKRSITFIDNFKLRGSWGRTGNDRMEVNGVQQEWNFMSIYNLNYPVIFGITEQNRTLAEVRVGYPDATWEVANQANVGFEADFFNNHMFLEMDYFHNIRSGILWTRNASVPQTAGFVPPYENLGYNNEAGGLKYKVGINGGYAKNKILFWDESPGAPEWQRSTGNPMNTGLYYRAAGIFRDQAHVDATPAKWANARPGDVIFEDLGGPEGKGPDGKIDSYDRIRIDKNDLPRFMGGLTANLQWKGFDLDVLVQTATGAVRYVSTESGEIGNFTKDFYDNRWTPENPNATQPRTFNRGDEYWRNQANTQFLQNSDYVRLKNLVLGYTLPGVLTKRVGLQSVRFYASAFNLLTYSPGVKDFDPESNNSQGTNYPLQKVVNGGLTLTF
jgi:TonB-linked SusC/RagA family outer membrane protein